MSKRYESSLLFGGDFSEQWHICKEFPCVVGIGRAPRPPETRASFGVPGAISPLPLSSLAVTAKSLLRKSGLSDQHWSKHNGEVVVAAAQGGGGAVVWDFAQGSDGFNTFNRTQKPAPALLHREREEPDAWQDNCEVILTASDAMRVGSLWCKRWPVRRQLNMLPSKVVNYRGDIDVKRPF